MIFRTSCVVHVSRLFLIYYMVFLGEFNASAIFPDQPTRKIGIGEHPTFPATSQSFNLHQRSGPGFSPLDSTPELDNIANADQFLQPSVGEGAQDFPRGIANYKSISMSGGQQPKLPPEPTFAHCDPELRTIKLQDTNDSSVFYFPSCTRIERCGGCCSHESLMCEATEKEYVNYTVLVMQKRSEGRPRSYRVISVEKHMKCKCGCRIKKEDCTSLQVYEEKNCQCVCKDSEKEASCLQQENKLWNSSSCKCQCQDIIPCLSGFHFDYEKCTCVAGKH